MLLALVCLFATASAGTISYDRRQDGKLNAQLDISNVMFLFALPSKIPATLFEFFAKGDRSFNNEPNLDQDKADVRVMEAFVEPSNPYRVEIGSDESSKESDGRAAEVVIAGRRRLGADLPEAEQDELKLLGSTENCGPGRVRDSISLMCKDIEATKADSESKETEEKVAIIEVQPAPEPEVISS